jgi:hypothetical protein
VWLARGDGVTKRPGQGYSEAERFILNDPVPILTEYDTGKRYKVGTDSYKDLGMTYIPLVQFDTACACSAFETKLQVLFDSRRYGIQRLWKQAGAGKLYQKYRRCDINYMQKTGDYSPVFTVGMSVIPHVRMQSSNSAHYVTSMTSGVEGQLSAINPPARWKNTWARNRDMFGEDAL